MALSADAKNRLKYALNNETYSAELATAIDDNTVARTANTAALVPLAWTASTEHGAGAIGTARAPTTHRRTENGTIITEIKIDLTGLASVAAADDIIGLAASTPPAYIGKHVVANNGIVYRVEMICLELPTTGDDDINLVSGTDGTERVDDAVTGAAVVINGGTWAAGTMIINNVAALGADRWLYLTSGETTADMYTAGMFIIRLYGHALLA